MYQLFKQPQINVNLPQIQMGLSLNFTSISPVPSYFELVTIEQQLQAKSTSQFVNLTYIFQAFMKSPFKKSSNSKKLFKKKLEPMLSKYRYAYTLSLIHI
eukprot:TRINITY_DN5429_c0_g1_i1.p2 TRINITY_DN5429_c0_g1~~TRINITY_DN5429_c0_g1_i1.p2  ORF type:complete len:100 (-),score=8.20 TRINITY_DN5429_c0_g1_i1:183-482(-)